MVNILLKEYTVMKDGLQKGHSHRCSMNRYVMTAMAVFGKEKGPWAFAFKEAALANFLRLLH
jgi:hypothetical protein